MKLNKEQLEQLEPIAKALRNQASNLQDIAKGESEEIEEAYQFIYDAIGTIEIIQEDSE